MLMSYVAVCLISLSKICSDVVVKLFINIIQISEWINDKIYFTIYHKYYIISMKPSLKLNIPS